MGHHFLLQCMKVKSESEITQSCPTVSDPMEQPTRLLRPWIFQARVLEWVAIAFSAPPSSLGHTNGGTGLEQEASISGFVCIPRDQTC